jgi:nucleoside-diphosphate-sugar epimerase
MHNHALQVRIARIFNTYGPRMCIDDGRVVSNFVAQVTSYAASVVHTSKYIFSSTHQI